MTNLDRLTYYDDPVDRWASITEFTLRRQAYIRHLTAQTTSHVKSVTEQTRRLSERVDETRTALLAFQGIPIELQDEVNAARMYVRRRAMVDQPGPRGES